LEPAVGSQEDYIRGLEGIIRRKNDLAMINSPVKVGLRRAADGKMPQEHVIL
jgi:hypothetical protein